MSSTARILVISIGGILLLATGAAFFGISLGKSFRKELLSGKIIGHPPDEYLEVFNGQDSGKLMFMENRLFTNLNPICTFRYGSLYEIVEAKLAFSAGGKLSQRIDLAQDDLPDPAYGNYYETFAAGRISVLFKHPGSPDSALQSIFLTAESKHVNTILRNDSLVCYVINGGYFGVSRARGAPRFIYSKERWDNDEDAGVPTVLLFKRRGNSVFMLIESPVAHPKKVGSDLLLRRMAGFIGE